MIDAYQSQRAMRAMRRAAMQRGVIAVLDVGTSKIACFVLQFDGAAILRAPEGTTALAGQSAFRIVGAAHTRSRGVRWGAVEAVHETERAVRTAVTAAQKMAQVRVDHVIACFSGGEPWSAAFHGRAEIEGGPVTEHHVARALAACELPDLGPGREMLHAQPVNFSVDGRQGNCDPRGQLGELLSCDMHTVSVSANAVASIAQCVRRCDLELAGLVSSSYAAGLSALVEDEQELGAACVDMGGGSVGVSMFWRKHMIGADGFDMGGDVLTVDISKILQVSLSTAERIKTLYGGVEATSRDDAEMIPLGGESGDWERDTRTVSRTELIGIIRPRVCEILDEVRHCLERLEFHELPSNQVVLTGGMSQIPGLDTLAARVLGRQVRIGRPLRVPGLPDRVTGSAFSAAVGTCCLAAHPQDEWWDFEMPVDRYPARSLRRAVRWFKDNW